MIITNPTYYYTKSLKAFC